MVSLGPPKNPQVSLCHSYGARFELPWSPFPAAWTSLTVIQVISGQQCPV
jgi:hypothetical protein